MNRNRTFWGIMVMLVGIALLVNSLGFLHFNVWKFLGPAVLILLGLWFILNAMLGKPETAPQSLSIPCQGEDEFSLDISHGAGHLRLTAAVDTTKLLSGTFANGVDSTISQQGRITEIKLKPFSDSMVMVMPGTMQAFNWSMQVHPNLPLNLNYKSGANESMLDFSQANLKKLELSTGASKTDVIFSSKPTFSSAKINAGVAEVNLIIPSEIAASITVHGKELSSININPDRFIQSGDRYESKDFVTAAKKLEIEINPGLGEINIR
jgi:hypothetical protein